MKKKTKQLITNDVLLFLHFIDFHKNSQLAPVDWLQFVVSIAIALSIDPIPFFFQQFHSAK